MKNKIKTVSSKSDYSNRVSDIPGLSNFNAIAVKMLLEVDSSLGVNMTV